ncbi:hypothetical protein EK21DRAFT_66021 [Setomelanomma holmii]|uniref:Transcription factor domain-containing protein n=1 Tax=Setomelanomma holmii TaxID=210430 RepID=A0A9P4H8U6_9PLEO|nr:hypothetical protein EK21DRAFT_66021 [Setomelanomma holmii]
MTGFAVYDPVETGLLGNHEVAMLLEEFRVENSQCFPFVLLDESISTDDFRHAQPFLFLSIMAVMSYRTPGVQNSLAEEFRDQVAFRITDCSLKGLEALQALLIHVAYYHFFYKPGKQQLALMVQMCVATAQDLGLARKLRDRDVFSSAPRAPPAEDRALLGTYFISAVFAQAWRKRTSMPYTRSIARAYQSFSEQPQHPSDLLIAPLVQLGDLICRINDYFSYDNIEDSEINGETLLVLSTNNFRTELLHFRESLPESIRRNVTLRLACDIIDVMIHECSFHENLWHKTIPNPSATMSQARKVMLQRSLVASQTFARSLLGTPLSSYHHLAFPAWSGWFYSTMLVVKMIILRQTGTTANLRVSSVPHAVGDFLPREFETLSQTDLGDGTSTAEEVELVSIFESFIAKLNTVLSSNESNDKADCASTRKPFLHKVATLQTGLLAGVKKLTEKKRNESTSTGTNDDVLAQHSEPMSSIMQDSAPGPDPYQHGRSNQSTEYTTPLYHMQSADSLGFGYLDGYPSIGDSMPQLPVDDWLWTMAMNDGNLFTL